jgi:hypothetical protein
MVELEIAAYLLTGLLFMLYRQLCFIQTNLDCIGKDIVELKIELQTLVKKNID